MKLEGKVALVTGAGAGIGRAVAEALAAEGAAVGVNVMNNTAGGEATVAAIEGRGGRALLLPGDVSEPGAAEAMVARLAGTDIGAPTILVNNAGIGSPGSPDRPHEIALSDWDRVMAVNLRAALQCARACLPAMLEANAGAIVNVSSIRGITAARGLSAYCASKGGLISLTQEMALEYARSGIRVNAVSPGFVESEMLLGYISRQDDPAAARSLFETTAAMNRIGRPDEIAEAVVFLASEDASFVTGANLVVDGGNMANGMRAFL